MTQGDRIREDKEIPQIRTASTISFKLCLDCVHVFTCDDEVYVFLMPVSLMTTIRKRMCECVRPQPTPPLECAHAPPARPTSYLFTRLKLNTLTDTTLTSGSPKLHLCPSSAPICVSPPMTIMPADMRIKSVPRVPNHSPYLIS